MTILIGRPLGPATCGSDFFVRGGILMGSPSAVGSSELVVVSAADTNVCAARDETVGAVAVDVVMRRESGCACSTLAW